MIRSLVLAGWEIKRTLRSRAFILVILVPAVGIIAHLILHGGNKDTFLSCIYPAVALFINWMMLYARSFSDRASGFAAGLESTPAAGLTMLAARFMAGIIIAAFQAAVFYGIKSIL